MSDNTPAGADDHDVEPVEEDVAAVSEDNEPDSVENKPADSTESKPAARIVRKTAAAPVRRRKPSTPEDDDKEIAKLEEEFSVQERKSAPRMKRRTSPAPVKRTDRARPGASAAAAVDVEEENPYSTRNPAEFAKQATNELKKVVWPTRKEMGAYFAAVLVFVLFIITFVVLLDALFGWTLLALLGD